MGKEKPGCLKSLVGIVFLLCLVLGGLGYLLGGEDESSSKTETAPEQEATETIRAAVIDVTYSDFISAFNAAAKKAGAGVQITKKDISPTGYTDDIFVTKNIHFFIRTDNNKKIEMVSVMADLPDDKTLRSATACIETMVSVLSPGKSRDEVRSFVDKMMWDQNLNKIRPTRGENLGEIYYVFNARASRIADSHAECDFSASPKN